MTLGFVKHIFGSHPVAIFLQFLRGAEVFGVVRHVEHRRECNAPGVALFSGGFIHQHGRVFVDLAGQFHIPAAAEDGARPRVGVEEREVLGRERERAVRIIGLRHIVQEEGTAGRLSGQFFARDERNAELETGVNVREEDFAVLEVQQFFQPALADDLLEVSLRCVVRGDAAGREDANAPAPVNQFQRLLREQRVQVGIAAPHQREEAGLLCEPHRVVGAVPRGAVGGPETGVGLW